MFYIAQTIYVYIKGSIASTYSDISASHYTCITKDIESIA